MSATRGTTVDRCVDYALSGWPLRPNSAVERRLRGQLARLRREDPARFESAFRRFLRGEL